MFFRIAFPFSTTTQIAAINNRTNEHLINQTKCLNIVLLLLCPGITMTNTNWQSVPTQSTKTASNTNIIAHHSLLGLNFLHIFSTRLAKVRQKQNKHDDYNGTVLLFRVPLRIVIVFVFSVWLGWCISNFTSGNIFFSLFVISHLLAFASMP